MKEKIANDIYGAREDHEILTSSTYNKANGLSSFSDQEVQSQINTHTYTQHIYTQFSCCALFSIEFLWSKTIRILMRYFGPFLMFFSSNFFFQMIFIGFGYWNLFVVVWHQIRSKFSVTVSLFKISFGIVSIYREGIEKEVNTQEFSFF